MSLAARSLTYYLKTSVQYIGYSIAIAALIFVEFLFIHSGEVDAFGIAFRMAVSILALFIAMLNPMYALYSPNWYDGNVLSMGGRRKDIFWGSIVKEILFILMGLIIVSVIYSIYGTPEMIPIAVYLMFGSLPFTGLARIIGHKIRKNGRIAVIAIAIVAGLSAAAASMISNSRLYDFNFLPEGGVSMLLYILIALGIYAVLQIFIYRLCSKAMVR